MRTASSRAILMVGSGPRAAREIARLRGLTPRPVVLGYIDSSEREDCGPVSGVPYLGGVQTLPDQLASRTVDEVVIALPLRSCYDAAQAAIEFCVQQGVPARIPVDLFDIRPGGIPVPETGNGPCLTVHPVPRRYAYLVAKRAMDIVVAGAAIVLLAPVCALIAVLIKLDSPGPVFFVQQRVGLNKRLFRLFKFRTMTAGADRAIHAIASLNETDGPAFKIRRDPRVTRLGSFLRRTSLDELPQFVNVLRGEMSLVGPRPLPPRDVDGFSVHRHRRRFSVKPGMTGLWQVEGRSDLSFDRWMTLDLLYIEQRCLRLDFDILLRTIPAVVLRRGAY